MRPSSAGSELKVDLLAKVSKQRWTQDHDLAGRGHHQATSWLALLALSWQATGVIYGDILTSCLYVMTGIFEGKGGGKPTVEEALGVTSLIIWTIFALVVCKYALIVLWADDNGNGGTFALFSLVRRATALQLEVQGPDLPSDYTLTRYSVHPDDPFPKHNAAVEADGAAHQAAEANVDAEYGGVGEGSVRGVHLMQMARREEWINRRTASKADWRLQLGKSWWLRKTISVMVVTGVGFVLGDGTITPAISVLSAVEGLKGVVHGIHRKEVVMITVAILIGLFTIQRFGTSKVSVVFAPIIALWLAFNTAIGIHNILTFYPGVVAALNPGTWMAMAWAKPLATWYKLSGVLLCVTGTEALFADLAHFSRPAIQLSCLALVFPALVITYLGQGAYLAAHPHHVNNLFWKSVPQQAYMPMLALATLATITASQALISAVFSVVAQAMSQGFFPKFGVVHTSREVHGQIYIPVVNNVMMLLTVGVVFIFRESARLGAAYGIAVCCDMLLTTLFTSLVICLTWRMSPAVSLLFVVVFGSIEGAFFSASLSKIPNGGWLTLLMASVWGLMMWTWNWGSIKKMKFNEHHMKRLRDVLRQEVRIGSNELEERVTLLETGERMQRYAGVGLYFCETVQGVPPGVCNLFRKVPALPRVVVFVTNRRVPVPEVMDAERLLVAPLALSGFYHVVARYGYMQDIRQGKRFAQQIIAHLNDLLMQSRTLHQQVMQYPTALSPPVVPVNAPYVNGTTPLSSSAPSTASAMQRGSDGLVGRMTPSASRTSLQGDCLYQEGINSPAGVNYPCADTPPWRQVQGPAEPLGQPSGQGTCAGTARGYTGAPNLPPGVPADLTSPPGAHNQSPAGGKREGDMRILERSGHSNVSNDGTVGSTTAYDRVSTAGGLPGTPGLAKGLWRSLSDSVLRSEDTPFSSEQQPLPYAPSAEASQSNAARSFLEEEAVRVQALDQEIDMLRRNCAARTVCFFGRTHIRAREGSNFWRRAMLEYAYQLLVNNFTPSAYEAFGLPLEQVIEVAQVYKL